MTLCPLSFSLQMQKQGHKRPHSELEKKFEAEYGSRFRQWQEPRWIEITFEFKQKLSECTPLAEVDVDLVYDYWDGSEWTNNHKDKLTAAHFNLLFLQRHWIRTDLKLRLKTCCSVIVYRKQSIQQIFEARFGPQTEYDLRGAGHWVEGEMKKMISILLRDLYPPLGKGDQETKELVAEPKGCSFLLTDYKHEDRVFSIKPTYTSRLFALKTISTSIIDIAGNRYYLFEFRYVGACEPVDTTNTAISPPLGYILHCGY
jgi:hypothetical protein